MRLLHGRVCFQEHHDAPLRPQILQTLPHNTHQVPNSPPFLPSHSLTHPASTAIQSESTYPPQCCKTALTPKTILSNLPRPDRSKYLQKSKEYHLPPKSRVYCPHADCGSWVPPKNESTCPKCLRPHCQFCKKPVHPPVDNCEEDQGMEGVIAVARENGWKRCYRCHAFVERTSGCRHMQVFPAPLGGCALTVVTIQDL